MQDVKIIEKTEKNVADKRRRNFLKILALGGGALVLGKLMSGKTMEVLTGQDNKTEQFDNFLVSEKNGEFTVASKDGTPLFVMDNGK